MKNLRITSLVAVFLLIILSQATQAQKKKNDAPREWKFVKTIVYDDAMGFAAFTTDAKENGIVQITAQATTGWEIPLPGYVIGLSRWRDNIIAFYSSEKDYKTFVKEVHAAAISVKEQKIISDKIVYSNAAEYLCAVDIQNDPSGNFMKIFVRTTGMTKNKNDYDKKVFITTDISVVTLPGELLPAVQHLPSVAIGGGICISSCTDKQGATYISTITAGEDQLVTEKFNAAGQLQAKLSTAIVIDKNGYFDPVMAVDTFSGNTVELAISYWGKKKDRFMRVFGFDFTANKVFSSTEDLLDKDYARNFRENKTYPVKRYNINFVENLIPVGIVTTQDKIIVLKDIERNYYAGGGISIGMREASIISIYDKNLQLKYEPAIDKTVATYQDIGVGLSYKLKDGKLHIAAGDDVGATVANISFGDVYYTVDLSTGVMTKNILDRSGFDKSFIMQPSATLWFPGGFVIALTYGRHFNNVHRATSVFERHY